MKVTALIPAALLAGPLAVLVAQVPRPFPQPSTDVNLQRGNRGAAPLRDPASLPLDKIKLPPGFSIALWANRVPGARSMTPGGAGTIFVGTREGTVYAVIDRDEDQKAEEVLTIATGLNSPNGVAFKDGSLYVAEISRLSRFDGVLEFVKVPGGKGPAPKHVVLNDKLPTDRQHGWKYLAFGPDGLLYFQIGAPGNVLNRGDPYATIVRTKPDGSNLEIYAHGVRNSVGMTWHPDTKELWFTENGRDLLGDDIPNDELNHAPKPGMHFGYPFCHEGSILDPEFGAGKSCSEYTPPVQKLGPHVAALGLKFYGGSMFPAQYRKQLLIAQHGSWNRTPAAGHIGYRVMVVRLEGTKAVGYETFADGWLEGGDEAWGRPVDLLERPDGSLLVSDDRAGVIYRISYRL